jgi:hypothetical protein
MGLHCSSPQPNTKGRLNKGGYVPHPIGFQFDRFDGEALSWWMILEKGALGLPS